MNLKQAGLQDNSFMVPSITMLYFFLQAHILEKAYIVSLNVLVSIRK